MRPRSSRRPRPGRHRAGYMSGSSRLVTGGDWRTRRPKSTLGSGVTPGPHAPIGRSSGPSAATPLTQLPFGSPAASRPVARTGACHGSPMCAFELGGNSSPTRHLAGAGSPMLFSAAAQTATTPHEQRGVMEAYAGEVGSPLLAAPVYSCRHSGAYGASQGRSFTGIHS